MSYLSSETDKHLFIEMEQQKKNQNDDFKNDCNGNALKKGTTVVKNKLKSKNKKREQNILMNLEREEQKNCSLCDKPVYKMEEVKAEKNIYHKSCFRCHECNKQLKMDTYQSHEGVLHCIMHFKLLFAPQFVENDLSIQWRKPELIIRENQPTELPPDVIRASDKPNLGLEELQQLNVRSRFKVFENVHEINNKELQKPELQRCTSKNAIGSAVILSKVAKLERLGSSSKISQETIFASDNNEETDSLDSDDLNSDIIRPKKKNIQKHERPIGLGAAMNDIRTLFEKGHGIRKEERREERKQEIQHIRSRLFMGKQARIKELYQQAAADSEQVVTNKESEILINVDSKLLRERFENGNAISKNKSDIEDEGDDFKKSAIERDADVFELGISKKSRSIFVELDANIINGKKQNILHAQNTNRQPQTQPSTKIVGTTAESKEESTLYQDSENYIVKCGEPIEDVLIQTSEISSKFKFFETYNPNEKKNSVLSITLPRNGKVEMNNCIENEKSNESPNKHVIAHSRTTTMMIDIFRELEKQQETKLDNSPKPLKCFTPPPNDNRRLYDSTDSDGYEDDSDIEENDEENNFCSYSLKREAFKEAQNAARATQLKVKFEKWQANEIENEKDCPRNCIGILYNEADDSIESTQSLRERFEKLMAAKRTPQPTTQRHQVNRFV